MDYYTHYTNVDYNIGDTRIVCNPFGYVNIETNEKFSHIKTIKL